MEKKNITFEEYMRIIKLAEFLNQPLFGEIKLINTIFDNVKCTYMKRHDYYIYHIEDTIHFIFYVGTKQLEINTAVYKPYDFDTFDMTIILTNLFNINDDFDFTAKHCVFSSISPLSVLRKAWKF